MRLNARQINEKFTLTFQMKILIFSNKIKCSVEKRIKKYVPDVISVDTGYQHLALVIINKKSTNHDFIEAVSLKNLKDLD